MLPKFTRIRQNIPAPKIEEVGIEALRSINCLMLTDNSLEGLKVGITVGSRGIANIQTIVLSVIDFVRRHRGSPVIIPAMGTHGGGTTEGQLAVLESLGITPETMRVPIIANVDTALLGYTDNKIPVYCNSEILKMDKVILVNRIKPHTDFSGEIESGICKMMAIGLGNPRGAMITHSHALTEGYEKVITAVADVMLKKIPVLFALAITENWKGQTMGIETIFPEKIAEREKELLKQVKESMNKLPFKDLDVLVIQEIGKNISGTGMDTKVVGRIMVKGQKEPDYPLINRIVVLGLTPESHGNAIGLGLADITTEEVFHSIDISTTSFNSISSMCPEQGRIPCIVKNDHEAINAAVATLGAIGEKGVRVAIIRNTLRLETFAVSEALLEEAKKNANLVPYGEMEELSFDGNGHLLTFGGENW